LEKSTLSGARPFSDIGFRSSVTKDANTTDTNYHGHGISAHRYLESKNAANNCGRPEALSRKSRMPAKHESSLLTRSRKSKGFDMLAAGLECEWKTGETTGTRVASARRRTKPLREGLADLGQFNCQFSSATVTNPGLIPVDTNANLRC
jgi:hypothetical protein